MVKPYAYRIDYADDTFNQVEVADLESARQACTEVMAGKAIDVAIRMLGREPEGDPGRPTRVSLLARDAGEYREVWSAKL